MSTSSGSETNRTHTPDPQDTHSTDAPSTTPRTTLPAPTLLERAEEALPLVVVLLILLFLVLLNLNQFLVVRGAS